MRAAPHAKSTHTRARKKSCHLHRCFSPLGTPTVQNHVFSTFEPPAAARMSYFPSLDRPSVLGGRSMRVIFPVWTARCPNAVFSSFGPPIGARRESMRVIPSGPLGGPLRALWGPLNSFIHSIYAILDFAHAELTRSLRELTRSLRERTRSLRELTRSLRADDTMIYMEFHERSWPRLGTR